jgi:hypothetical protein
MPARLHYLMGFQDFHTTYEILFAVLLKHSNLGPSADVKPTK